MRHHIKFLAAAAAIAFLIGNASAQEPIPATPPGPAASTPAAPAPAPAQGPESTPAPAARKEEEGEPGFLSRIAAYASSKKQLATTIAGHEAELTNLRAAVADRDATIAALQQEVAAQRADLERIGAWLQSQGHGAYAASNPAAAFEAAVSEGVGAAVRSLGVPAVTIPAATSSEAASLKELEEQLANCKSIRERQDFLAKHKDRIFGKN
jgi:septal ring factor EnvC (AmiA/AmiB activator)